jgi:hypothetical protein
MRLLILFYCLSTIYVFAQKKITSIPVIDEIVSAGVDRVGELYVTTKLGQIQKFDTQGKLLSVYRRVLAPSLFEPRDGSRLFAFFKKDRRIEYLDPAFEIYSASRIDSAFVIDPLLACSSGDHNVWVLDGADQTLKKINPRASTIEVDVKFPENLSRDYSQIKFMREYQGFIFFLDDKRGIHIFNGMGRWIKTISLQHPSYFNFLGEELYYPGSNKLILINLFSGEQREIPLAKPFKIALLTDERLFLIQTNSIDFFEFKP